MKKKIIMIAAVCSIGLIGCTGKIEPISTTAPTTESNTEIKDLDESIEAGTSGIEFDYDTKMEIFSFIQIQIDSLNETSMSFNEKENVADEIWKEAETKFNITESDIMLIMSDVELIEEYYLNLESDGALKSSTDDKVVVARFRDSELTNYQYCVDKGLQDVVDRLKNEGRVFSVTNGTRIKLVHYGLSITELELLDGENKGEIVYAFSEEVLLK